MSSEPAAPDRAELAERVADAVRAHPAVARLHGGPFGAVASYLPGRRIDGVRIAERGGGIELAVAIKFGQRIPAVARQLRQAVRELAGDVPVNILIVDVVDVAVSEQNDSPMEDT